MAVAMKPVHGMLNGRAKNKSGSAGPNEVGEIHVHGPTAALGYKGNDKVMWETFVDGWVCTGDQVQINEDGVLL
jgi:long-subunit acyl-CoA synthetase (AMP-forming)